METVELKALEIGLQQMLSSELLGTNVKIVQDILYNGVRVAIRGFVWAENESVRRQEVKYPRDWWQAFKERWFPKWLLEKYPVDYHIVVLDVTAIYPDFKQAVPEFTSRLIIQKHEGFSSDYWRGE
jgi:hypothetical protein